MEEEEERRKKEKAEAITSLISKAEELVSFLTSSFPSPLKKEEKEKGKEKEKKGGKEKPPPLPLPPSSLSSLPKGMTMEEFMNQEAKVFKCKEKSGKEVFISISPQKIVKLDKSKKVSATSLLPLPLLLFPFCFPP